MNFFIIKKKKIFFYHQKEKSVLVFMLSKEKGKKIFRIKDKKFLSKSKSF